MKFLKKSYTVDRTQSGGTRRTATAVGKIEFWKNFCGFEIHIISTDENGMGGIYLRSIHPDLGEQQMIGVHAEALASLTSADGCRSVGHQDGLTGWACDTPGTESEVEIDLAVVENAVKNTVAEKKKIWVARAEQVLAQAKEGWWDPKFTDFTPEALLRGVTDAVTEVTSSQEVLNSIGHAIDLEVKTRILVPA